MGKLSNILATYAFLASKFAIVNYGTVKLKWQKSLSLVYDIVRIISESKLASN